MENIKIVDLIIIGAGWSGLTACKYAKQNNLSVIVFESKKTIGGIWKYDQDSKKIQ